MPEQIRDYFGDRARWSVEIIYSHEPELFGTAGGIKKMEQFLHRGGLFLVQYGDVLTDQNLTEMVMRHCER